MLLMLLAGQLLLLCCGLSTRPTAMLLLLLVFLCLQFCRAIGSFSTRSRIGRSCRCGCVVVAVVTAGLKFIECFVAELSNCCEILLDLRKIGRANEGESYINNMMAI